ncbi:SDR family NAD(P)-dependent oxidoreductase [Nocardioides caldifontis]|uniref:SDR family NAD(P)-dependent oxidoreductase n=1 Tax=Nocardioides caldifontis TaxID=2588938 RepID=UPI0011DF6B86|nr:SDR family NAD(P)-dependent oxidoreductase [Nocardioides caldifontis]
MTVAVVTGAASGIGHALASQLAREGHLVHLADVTPTAELAAQLGGVPHQVDVADSQDMQRLADNAADAAIVCLNAGIVGPTTGAPWEAVPAEWDRVLRVNLGGVVNGLRAFVPGLLQYGHPAHLVITASLAGLLTFPGGGAYAASKHAVLAVAEQAALALADTNVTVTVLCPALVRTRMSEIGDDPAEVAADALAAARAGQFLVTPSGWEEAIQRRTDLLTTGGTPQMPRPTAEPDVTSAYDVPPTPGVRQMRLVVEAAEYDEALRFYRDVLGAPVELQIHGDQGEKVTILDAGRATLELSNPEQVAMIDRFEVGRRVAPHLRVAFEVDDVDEASARAKAAGATMIAEPTLTPWQSRNARLTAPAGLQLTLFEEPAAEPDGPKGANTTETPPG